MASQVHEFKVEMTCEGCSNAVKRVIGKLEGGVNKLDIDLATQIVLVDSTLPLEIITETLKKTGKNVTYVGVKS